MAKEKLLLGLYKGIIGNGVIAAGAPGFKFMSMSGGTAIREVEYPLGQSKPFASISLTGSGLGFSCVCTWCQSFRQLPISVIVQWLSYHFGTLGTRS